MQTYQYVAFYKVQRTSVCMLIVSNSTYLMRHMICNFQYFEWYKSESDYLGKFHSEHALSCNNRLRYPQDGASDARELQSSQS